MKVSEITTAFLREHYVHCNDTDANNQLIDMALAGAIAFVKSQTNLDDTKLDTLEDMPLAVCALVADLFDVRQYTVTGAVTINPVTANILGRYDYNFF